MALKEFLSAIKAAFRGGGRAIEVKKRDRIGEKFGAGPSEIAAAMQGTLSGEWEAFGDLCAIFDRYLLADPHLLSEYEKRRTAATKWPWRIIASPDDPQGEAIAEDIEAQLRNLPRLRRKLLRELSDAIGKGFAAVELTADYDGKRAALTDTTGIPQWSLRRKDGQWEVKLDSGWQPVPAGKVLFYERDNQGTVLTSGLMWPLIWYALFKNFAMKDWVAFLEVYGVPLRVGYYPAQFDEGSPEVEVLCRAVMNIASDAGVAIPDGMKIEFKEAMTTGTSEAFIGFAQYVDKAISKVLLGGTLTSDAGDKGARSLGEVHEDQLDILGGDDASDLAEALDEGLVKLLVLLNYGERPGYPKWKFNTRTSAQQAQRLNLVQGAVNMRLPIAVDYCYEEFGIPKPEPDDELLQPAPIPMQPGPVMAAEAIGKVTVAEADPAVAATANAAWALEDGLVESGVPLAVRHLGYLIDRLARAVSADDFNPYLVDDLSAWLSDAAGGTFDSDFSYEFAPALAAAMLAGIDASLTDAFRLLPRGRSIDRQKTLDQVADEIGMEPTTAAESRLEISALGALDGATGEIARDETGEIAWSRVTPQRALDWWKKRVGYTAGGYRRLDEAARRYAFTIAGQQRRIVIDAAAEAIRNTLERGDTVRDFARAVRQAAAEAGVDPLSPWRIKQVWQQNVSTALSAGRLASQRSAEVKKVLPSLTYHSIRDGRERADHRALDGMTKPVDDPIWQTYYPPWDWGCRCWVTSTTTTKVIDPPYLPPVPADFQAGSPLSFWKQTAEAA